MFPLGSCERARHAYDRARMSEDQTIEVVRDERGVATVTMSRPQTRNAFDDRLIDALHTTAGDLGADDRVRVVVLTGAGAAFSAGADLNWMRSTRTDPYEDNVAGSARLEAMFRALYDLPKPLVGRVNGPALGGGAGLAAVCDVVVALADADFGFPEVRLGLVPAVISPYVVRAVGASFARVMFVTGERFGAPRAREAGLIHEVAADLAALDTAVAAVVDRCLRAGPLAVAAAKRLPDLALRALDEVAAETVPLIARLRAGEEAQEGMAAFLERRAAAWARGE